MKIFGQLIRTVVNVAVLPIRLTQDAVMSMGDVGTGKPIGHRTAKQLERLMDDAEER